MSRPRESSPCTEHDAEHVLRLEQSKHDKTKEEVTRLNEVCDKLQVDTLVALNDEKKANAELKAALKAEEDHQVTMNQLAAVRKQLHEARDQPSDTSTVAILTKVLAEKTILEKKLEVAEKSLEERKSGTFFRTHHSCNQDEEAVNH